MVRQYDPTEGAILVDDVDIKNWDLPTLKSYLGWVPQEAFLFSDTIANNIAFGMDTMEIDAVKSAAMAAGVHENIMGFDKQYLTKVGERGITLSGGQKQRVSIARALIKSPKVIILDDCLSAVDTETEEQILSNLRKATENLSGIIIAHRVSSVKHCQQIICLDKGVIIERGTPAELEAVEGHYSDLIKMQLEGQFEGS
jgi:ATP-binding cassette subfamily B protein